MERLRIAVATAHSTRGGQLRLHCSSGECVVVGTHPAADIDPCKMRQIVVAGLSRRLSQQLQQLTSIEFAGTLEDLGGGVFRVERTDMECRTFATFLAPCRLFELIAELPDVDDTEVEATIRPDSSLGVSVIELRAPLGQFGMLDDVVARLAASCFAEEVVANARTDAERTQPADVVRRQPGGSDD
ncbi:MAG: hypothetical protein AAFY28_16980 [Actinomycetota bacterium]